MNQQHGVDLGGKNTIIHSTCGVQDLYVDLRFRFCNPSCSDMIGVVIFG